MEILVMAISLLLYVIGIACGVALALVGMKHYIMKMCENKEYCKEQFAKADKIMSLREGTSYAIIVKGMRRAIAIQTLYEEE